MPPFFGGVGDTWLCANGGGREGGKSGFTGVRISKGDSRRRIRLLLAVLAGDLVPDRFGARGSRHFVEGRLKVARAETTQMCGGGGGGGGSGCDGGQMTLGCSVALVVEESFAGSSAPDQKNKKRWWFGCVQRMSLVYVCGG